MSTCQFRHSLNHLEEITFPQFKLYIEVHFKHSHWLLLWQSNRVTNPYFFWATTPRWWPLVCLPFTHHIVITKARWRGDSTQSSDYTNRLLQQELQTDDVTLPSMERTSAVRECSHIPLLQHTQPTSGLNHREKLQRGERV